MVLTSLVRAASLSVCVTLEEESCRMVHVGNVGF